MSMRTLTPRQPSNIWRTIHSKRFLRMPADRQASLLRQCIKQYGADRCEGILTWLEDNFGGQPGAYETLARMRPVLAAAYGRTGHAEFLRTKDSTLRQRVGQRVDRWREDAREGTASTLQQIADVFTVASQELRGEGPHSTEKLVDWQAFEPDDSDFDYLEAGAIATQDAEYAPGVEKLEVRGVGGPYQVEEDGNLYIVVSPTGQIVSEALGYRAAKQLAKKLNAHGEEAVTWGSGNLVEALQDAQSWVLAIGASSPERVEQEAKSFAYAAKRERGSRNVPLVEVYWKALEQGDQDAARLHEAVVNSHDLGSVGSLGSWEPVAPSYGARKGGLLKQWKYDADGRRYTISKTRTGTYLQVEHSRGNPDPKYIDRQGVCSRRSSEYKGRLHHSPEGAAVAAHLYEAARPRRGARRGRRRHASVETLSADNLATYEVEEDLVERGVQDPETGRFYGSTKVQSVRFDRGEWSVQKAKDWLSDHDFRYGKVDKTVNQLRFRQFAPEDAEPGTFRTITPERDGAPFGVQFVIAVPAL